MADEGERKVETTKVVGVIIPPPELRVIVDKTAKFVAEKGTHMEERIRDKQKSNPKFSFLFSGDPYFAYYQRKIADGKAAVERKKEDEIADERAALKKEKDAKRAADREARAAAATEANAAVVKREALIRELARPVLAEKDLVEPTPLKFVVEPPPGARPLDLMIMRLTAKFAAANGLPFFLGLQSREGRNDEFAFLQPRHEFHRYFKELRECYVQLMHPPPDWLKGAALDAHDKTRVLRRVINRHMWEDRAANDRQAAEAANERERNAMLMIDWHDFVVVETIDFAVDELLDAAVNEGEADAAAPAPKPAAAAAAPSAGPAERPAGQPAPAAAAASTGPAPAPLPPAEDMDIEVQQEVDPQVKIVREYDFKAEREREAREREARSKMQYVTPKGQTVAVGDVAQHMRVELLDPRWMEQQKIAQERRETTILAPGEEIQRNLGGFIRTRQEMQDPKDAAAEDPAKKKKVLWDGFSDSAQVTAQAQFQASLERPPAPAAPDAEPVIGPARPAGGAPVPSSRPLGPMPGMPPPAGMMPPPPMVTGHHNMPPSNPSLMPPMVRSQPGGPPPGLAGPPPGLAGPPPGLAGPPPGLAGPPPGLAGPPPPVSGVAPGMMPPPLEHEAPPAEDQPEAKRARTMDEPVPASEWLERHPGPVEISVQAPDAGGKWNLTGQTISLTVELGSTVRQVKEMLSAKLEMPVSKQKLRNETVSSFKDDTSLAHYNVAPGAVLVLAVKERGGKKK